MNTVHLDEMTDSHWEVLCRPDARPQFSPLRDMIFEPGTRDDWDALHELHYKSTNSTGGRYYRVSLYGELIGVCVMTSPRGLLRPRHKLFPTLRPAGSGLGGKDTTLTNTHRYKWINANACLNSRTVVDTMYRGVGVAYRLLNLAARAEGKRFCEIQSSMSRFNLFAQKAGFVFAKPEQSVYYEAGLEFFRLNFRSKPVDWVAVMDEYRAMPENKQRVIKKKMTEFYFKRSANERTGNKRGGHGRREILQESFNRVAELGFGELLKNTQQIVFAMPLYGVYENPDAGRDLPERFPLVWFDRQKPNEPLIVD
jgi:ABC-type ATPase with predicted acetyltransferase domain